MGQYRGNSRKTRFFLIPFLLLAWFLFLIYRLYALHSGGAVARNNIRYKRDIKAMRGVIYDRGGNPIAVNETGWKIYLDPCADSKKPRKGQPPPDPLATCDRIAELVGRPCRDVWHDLVTTNIDILANGHLRTNRYVVQGVTWDPTAIDLATNKDLYVGNVGLVPMQRRYYPQGRRLCHILGIAMGSTPTGNSGGIEQRYESRLRGADGFIYGERAGNGREIRERRTSTVAAIDGAAIELTIDHNIQKIVHDVLSAAVEEWNADGARCIVEKVDTGEILAMVSLPDFDPEDWSHTPDLAKRNRAISDQYDPGSTMKAVTVAAGINEGIITPDSTYDVGGGAWHYGGGVLRDHAKGVINVSTIIAKSSNIGSAKIALDLGNRRFERYLKDFGFTAKTGIDLPGEARGSLPPASSWEPIKPTRVAIGQGISVTPIQMINAYATIANGGRRMRPYVMKRIVSPSGEVIERNHPKVLSTPITPETAATMREMLKGVVAPGGTARRARVAGYTVAGKTGTAQIVKPGGGYYDHNHYASFIGFLPADNPEVAILVLLDNPTKPGKSHDGGVSAAPAFAEIALATAQYLEIPVEDQQ
ncbi:MAG: penicillin-binding protein 2 [Kiritimatiellae bacterium]|nr:penicillin-binding protein 2 [Kiritimatiellia bacterium]